ncbi:MAG: SpaH/EbpB family LPXTG-anchored major pilin, partial [Fastidiosipila sp.]|nr:SpaH/EbpB family LPXTG-anchored major pilin [Fastidiosipila sp.]
FCSAAIGDILNFRIQAFVPKYHKDKRVYRYTFTDEMDAGLTYDADSIVLKIGNTILNNPNNYTVEIEGQKIIIALKAKESMGYPADANVEISYSAAVNETAIHENTNSVSMTWTEFDPEADPNDPNNLQSPDPENSPPTVFTKTYVYGFNLHKYKEEALPGNSLDGAEFRLYTAASNGEEIQLVKVAGKQYRKALNSEAGETILAGEAKIFGLDTGLYWLEETRAPDGYNQLTGRVAVEISEENTTEGYLQNEVQIINKAGITLPTTGGVGTHIFYLTGSLLMLAALLFLIRKTKQSISKDNKRI